MSCNSFFSTGLSPCINQNRHKQIVPHSLWGFLTWGSINPIKEQWLSNLYLGAELLSIPCMTAKRESKVQESKNSSNLVHTVICIYPKFKEFHSSGGEGMSSLWCTDHLVGSGSGFSGVQLCVCWFCARVGPVCTHVLPHCGKKKIQTPSVPNLIRFPKARGYRVQVWELRNNWGIHQKWHRCLKKGVFLLEWLFSQNPSCVQKNPPVPGLAQGYQSSVQAKIFPHLSTSKPYSFHNPHLFPGLTFP